MKFNIPSVGDKIELTKAWKFTVWSEGRNESLGEALGLYDPTITTYREPQWKRQDIDFGELKKGLDLIPPKNANDSWSANVIEYHNTRYPALNVIRSGDCTLKKGTILTIDRIYIRKGAKDYDSISFRINKSNEPRFKKKGIRFWVKLDEANNINYKPYEEE